MRVVDSENELACDHTVAERDDPRTRLELRVGDEPRNQPCVQRSDVAQGVPRCVRTSIDVNLFVDRSHVNPPGAADSSPGGYAKTWKILRRRLVARAFYGLGDTSSSASADDMTGQTSKSTMSDQADIQASRSFSSAV